VTVLVPAAGLLWLRDRGRTLLVLPGSGATWWIEGTDAALWDWLLQGHSYSTVLRLWQALLPQPAARSEVLLLATLRRWQAAGILEADAG
jgi:hypothetical protein